MKENNGIFEIISTASCDDGSAPSFVPNMRSETTAKLKGSIGGYRNLIEVKSDAPSSEHVLGLPGRYKKYRVTIEEVL